MTKGLIIGLVICLVLIGGLVMFGFQEKPFDKAIKQFDEAMKDLELASQYLSNGDNVNFELYSDKAVNHVEEAGRLVENVKLSDKERIELEQRASEYAARALALAFQYGFSSVGDMFG